jgi:Holliday junction DNA helicase RuvB
MAHNDHHRHHRHRHHYGFLIGAALYGNYVNRTPVLPSASTAPTGKSKSELRLAHEEAVRIVNGQAKSGKSRVELHPLNFAARSANELRPMTFDGMVGQQRLKTLLRRIVSHARASNLPLEHMLLIGSAGTGKTTVAQVVANELGRPVYQIKAPVQQDVLEALAHTTRPQDVVIVDEIHLFSKGDRRGVNPVAVAENIYSILEDRRLQTSTDVVPFPAVTFIGCTTDTGLLPEPFLARFPLQPRLEPYSFSDMIVLAQDNAKALSLAITPQGASVFAGASRGVPRVVNRYMRNARSLAASRVDESLAVEIVTQLNSTTLDGLDLDMQRMLTFLLRSARRNARGEVVYQAGVNSIATALGKSRDSRAISLYTEPYLVEQGLIQVTHGGRALTQAGAERAMALNDKEVQQ